MKRRFHVPSLTVGVIRLDAGQSRHLRDVLRIGTEEEVAVFDSGAGGLGRWLWRSVQRCSCAVAAIEQGEHAAQELTVAAAVPKGPRADWMVEKLSELGVHAYVPLRTARSVVHPERGKLQRWERIATESAKQCQRPGVMQIREPVELAALLAEGRARGAELWCLSTQGACDSAATAAAGVAGPVLALIGPEGGWTEGELGLMRRGAAPVRHDAHDIADRDSCDRAGGDCHVTLTGAGMRARGRCPDNL